MKPEIIKVDSCRICKSTNILNLDIIKNYYLSMLDLNLSMPYSCCKDCHFIFQSNYVGDDFLNYYYINSPMLRRSFFTEFDVDQSRSCYNFLKRTVNLDQKRILEIGAGGGALLKYISQFSSSSLFYSDLSKEAVLHLSSHKELHDLNDTTDKKFDLIILRHVIEHVFDLDSFFLYLQSLLKKSGKIFIEVPDWSILDIHTDPFIFEHLSQFNVSGLVTLMSKNSFQVDSLEKSIEKNDPSSPNRVVRIIAHLSEFPKLGSNEIKGYFKIFFDNYLEKWKFTLQKILKIYSNKKIALYPASSLTFDAIKSVDLRNVQILGMYDVDKKKQKKFFLGYEVFAPEKLKEHNPDLILTFSMGYEPEIRKSLIDMKLSAKILSIQDLINSQSNTEEIIAESI